MATLAGGSAVADNSKHGGVRAGAGRPKSADRKDGSVRIDRAVLGKIQWLAKDQGVTVSEYLTDLVRGPVEREFGRRAKKLQGEE
jgi:hypothetical protein